MESRQWLCTNQWWRLVILNWFMVVAVCWKFVQFVKKDWTVCLRLINIPTLNIQSMFVSQLTRATIKVINGLWNIHLSHLIIILPVSEWGSSVKNDIMMFIVLANSYITYDLIKHHFLKHSQSSHRNPYLILNLMIFL